MNDDENLRKDAHLNEVAVGGNKETDAENTHEAVAQADSVAVPDKAAVTGGEVFSINDDSPVSANKSGESTDKLAAKLNEFDDEGETPWMKFSHFTPWIGVLKMWGWLFAFGVSVSWQWLQNSFDDVEDLWGLLLAMTWRIAGWVFLAMLAISVISIVIATFRWKNASYKLDSEGIHLRSGVFVKKRDHLRWDRVQSVDVRRSFFAKLARQGALVIDSGASGAKTTLTLGLFPLQECERLRLLVLVVANDVRQGKTPNFAGINTLEIPDKGAFYALSRRRLLLGTAFSSAGILGLVFSLISIVLACLFDGGLSLIAIIALLVGPISNIIQMLNKNWKFNLQLVRDGLRKISGLTSTDTVTILPDRIHSVKISQPPLWRRFDWWQLEVAVTGFDWNTEASANKRLLIVPVGTREEVLRTLWTILPDLGVEAPDVFLREAMGDERQGRYFHTAPLSSRWIDPFGYKRNGVSLTETVVAFRWGRIFNRNLRFFLHGRFQGLTLSRGPLQRRLGLASVRMDMATINFSTVQGNLRSEDALAFIREEMQLGRRARAQKTAETITQWRERVGVTIEEISDVSEELPNAEECLTRAGEQQNLTDTGV